MVAAAVAALLVVAAFVPVLADNAFLHGLKAQDHEGAIGPFRRAAAIAPWSDPYVSRVATTERDLSYLARSRRNRPVTRVRRYSRRATPSRLPRRPAFAPPLSPPVTSNTSRAS